MSGADWKSLPGAPEPPEGPRPGVGADEALTGFPVVVATASRPLDRVRLAPVVAGALRAAIDGLTVDLPGRPSMRVTTDDAVLEVRLERVDPRGIVAAGGVLETVEANLVPAPHAPRGWTVRVPVLSPVESFLMIEREGLALALPWHAVSRVRMIPARDLAAAAAQDGAGIVEGFGADRTSGDDVPAVLIALGLRRAWLVVDRLVWRLPASPESAYTPPPRAGLGPALVTAEGDRFWLLELSRLLQDVPFPPLPSPGVRDPEAMPRFLVPEASPAPVAEPAVEPQVEATPRAPLRLVTLTHEQVTPIDDTPFEAHGLSEPEPAAEASGPPPVAADAPGPQRPRVLVAEDSITARIFLTRLLEQLGFEVDAVASLGDLRSALSRGPWAVVMADVELPDARGAQVFTGLHPRSERGPAPVVALVRDAADVEVALGAGVAHTLRKPFEREDLERLLIRLRVEVRDS